MVLYISVYIFFRFYETGQNLTIDTFSLKETDLNVHKISLQTNTSFA